VTPEDAARILIVDDRAANLLALEQVLAPLGYEITKARSGEQALRCLLNADFAVILLDVQMPGMNGYETASIIKQRDRCRHTPILFLTAVDTDPHDGYISGAVDFLTTPFRPSILRSKVAVFIDLYLERGRAERLSGELADAEARRRHALELNDSIVQRLAVAKYAFGLGDFDRARAAIDETLAEAKRVISELLLNGHVSPGDLVRQGRPASKRGGTG